MRTKSRGSSWLLLLLLLPVAVEAQSEGAVRDPAAPPVAEATRREGPVSVDGRLDEAAWTRAVAITDFRQYEPTEGASATLPTEIRILYDDEAIYIGARMTQPDGVVAPLARRDQLLDGSGNNGAFNSLTSDKLVVSLDPYHNRLDNVLFEVNPAGVRGDQLNGDPSWDPIWEAAAQVDSLGWTAEMRIPLSQLRFSAAETQSWGLQIWRYVDRLNERAMWSFWSRTMQGGPAFFGTLQGLAIATQPRQLELLPYLVTGSTLRSVDPADRDQASPVFRLGIGGDLKYLLTSNLTLDATFNPDFGQVEVDPATLNLTAFETFYEEKRPFFVAGASAFRFGRGRCMFCTEGSGIGAFYSRRIGRSPQLTAGLSQTAAHMDPPESTTILGAAKVTGRTQGGYTVGILSALTGQESARFFPTAGAGEERQVVEPLANYFVARVNREFGGGASTLGGIFTSTLRDTSDPMVRERLRSSAQAAGLDWYHDWDRRNYSWMGTTLVSNVSGSPSAIDGTMRSSARYFQRPDRRVTGDGLFDARYDPEATSLRGYGLATRVGKDGGGRLRWEAMATVRSPGLEVNDLAFHSRGDNAWINANVGGSWTTPTRWYRSAFNTVGGSVKYNFDGDRIGTTLQAFQAFQLRNYWNLRMFAFHQAAALDDQLTRGGPVVGRSAVTFGNVGISTDPRGTAVLDFQVPGYRGGVDGTRSLTLRPGVALKPSPSVFVQLSPGYAFEEDAAQFVTRAQDPTAAAFFGHRYVFAFIEKRTASIEARVNATFTPDLTLQLYAQPFIATGRYSGFREFAAPRSAERLTYGTDIGSIRRDEAMGVYEVDPDGAGPARSFTFRDPDFTARSLRGTAVVRWEYRPGSTLFLVWSQERSGYDRFDSFGPGAGRSLLLDDRATNVLQIKATYWIG
jgi:hypothetical protein